MDTLSKNLFRAISDHDAKAVAQLLSEGADPNSFGEGLLQHRPIHLAIIEMVDGSPLEIVETLVAGGADVNASDGHGDTTALLIAVSNDQRNVVPILIEARADPDVRGGDGDMPIVTAAASGDIETARLLVGVGVPETINQWNILSILTPLGLAAKRLDVPMIELLISAGADVETTDEDHKKARHRLPDRTPENTADWDRAAAMLRGIAQESAK